jgi:hypothetical protein
MSLWEHHWRRKPRKAQEVRSLICGTVGGTDISRPQTFKYRFLHNCAASSLLSSSYFLTLLKLLSLALSNYFTYKEIAEKEREREVERERGRDRERERDYHLFNSLTILLLVLNLKSSMQYVYSSIQSSNPSFHLFLTYLL